MNAAAAKLSQLTSLLAQRENLAPELQALLSRLGMDVVQVAFLGGSDAPVWAHPDIASQLDAALLRENCGMIDERLMAHGFYFLFFHCRADGRALSVIKAELAAHSLLDHAQILVAEAESGWRVYHPATAELIETAAASASESKPLAVAQPGLNAALANLDPEWQAMLARNGVDILLIAFPGGFRSPVFSKNAAWKQIGEAMQREGCGVYANSHGTRLADGESCYLCFYQLMNLARGLTTAKAELQRLDLLDCAQMFVCEPERQEWQQYWPAPGEAASP